MTDKRVLIVLTLAVMLLITVGCGNRPEPETDLDTGSEILDTDAAGDSETQEASSSDLSRFDDLFKKDPAEVEAEPAEPEPAPVLVMDDVHFEFDKYSLTAEARRILAQTARILKDNPALRLQIEGHCDDRGTQEYNLALGQRRAQAAKDYLVNFGVDPGRVSVISYGEERPLDPQATEEAWARNRRAHFNRR